MLRDGAAYALDELQVRSTPGADALGLRGRVDGGEEDVRVRDAGLHVGGEEEVPAAARLDNLLEPGLVDRQRVRAPGRDAGLVEVDDGHRDIGALERDGGHRGAADITSSDAADLVQADAELRVHLLLEKAIADGLR